jgi:hypothetical protein
MKEQLLHRNLVLVLGGYALPLRVLGPDVRVERRHTCQRLNVGVQWHARDLNDLMVTGTSASRFKINGSEQVAVQVNETGVDMGQSRLFVLTALRVVGGSPAGRHIPYPSAPS